MSIIHVLVTKLPAGQTSLKISYVVSISAVAVVLFIPFINLLQNLKSGVTPKPVNVVLIVLDGLGTQFLASYNPMAKVTEFENIAQESMLYTNMRTNRPFTMGYFNTLFSGHKKGKITQDTIFSVLQKNGVRTRWSTYHNNGVPDAQHLKYKGLRSAFLTQNYSWVPQFFNLDYNVFRAAQGSMGGFLGKVILKTLWMITVLLFATMTLTMNSIFWF